MTKFKVGDKVKYLNYNKPHIGIIITIEGNLYGIEFGKDTFHGCHSLHDTLTTNTGYWVRKENLKLIKPKSWKEIIENVR